MWDNRIGSAGNHTVGESNILVPRIHPTYLAADLVLENKLSDKGSKQDTPRISEIWQRREIVDLPAAGNR